MSFVDAFWLGLVQGLTEFLPISSSGHLVFAKAFLGLKTPGVVMEAVLHFGTLIAVLVFYREDLLRIVAGAWRAHGRALRLRSLRPLAADPDARLGYLLVAGTVPAAVVGIAFKRQIEALYSSPLESGIELFVNGFILLLAARLAPGRKAIHDVGVGDALWIGAGQAVAILPAISRSGSTVAAALWRRLDRTTAVRFSFLLSVPAILGALVLELDDIVRVVDGAAGPLAVGALASAVAGYLAIAVFTRAVARGRLAWFAWYCFVVGAVVTALVLLA